MATAPSPNDLTRQQLDELDALLQRMLALPLNNPESPAVVATVAPPAPPKLAPAPPRPDPAPPRPAPVPNWRIDPPAVPAAPAPHIAPQPPPPPPAVALVPEPEPPAAEPVSRLPESVAPLPPLISAPAPAPEPPAAVPAPAAAPPAPPPAPEPTFVFTAPKPEPAAVVAAEPETEPEPRPPVPVLLWPLVGLNWVFDTALGLFGPPGRLLRSTPMKYLYGLAGLGLLAYTGLKMAEVREWISLPVPLPWPR